MKEIMEFFTFKNTDLWANIAGGVATAIVLWIFAGLWRVYREYRVKKLGDMMAHIIEHRNAGRHLVPDPVVWVRKAKEL